MGNGSTAINSVVNADLPTAERLDFSIPLASTGYLRLAEVTVEKNRSGKLER
jgi:hypothetical protein